MRRPDFIRGTTTPGQQRPDGARVRAGRLTTASTFLGQEHPLVRAIEALETIVRQSLAVVGVVAGAIIALSEGAAWGGALAIAAAVALLGLAAVGAALEQRKRECARDLIIEGRESVPIAAVQHQRRRILARRKTVARTLEAMIAEARDRPRGPLFVARVPFDQRVVAAVADELRAVIRLLRADHDRTRGAALAERLLTDGASPLYGHHVEPLREELHRAEHLLGG